MPGETKGLADRLHMSVADLADPGVRRVSVGGARCRSVAAFDRAVRLLIDEGTSLPEG
jgi:hypothetical protein